ncbi:phage tail tape measure protein [Dorea formicigenerans]|uniref:Phage tail tape measure protein n=1 Tax=Dorea formicigenerans TaxID=39486 RepID=A0A3E5GSK9_9FIRM|nr:phage tail tape measure protein [Dorea formicigenerans]RGO50810.1 phage tail tape measure protein [Dorea formicigenerans]
MADGYLNFDTKINEKGFNEGISKLSNLGKAGLKVVTGAIATLGTAVGAGMTAVVKVGAAFESEMSKVSAISGATGDELQSLTDKAKEMGAKTKFSATESAQAMEYMAMAGWKTADMLNGIEGIMNLAAASGESLAATSDIVTDALTAFGLSAQDSTHFADVLAAASSNANTNVSMMGETFKYVAPVAGALGFSVEDCGVAIGLMANSGIKAGQAGTSLRQMLSRLTKPTKEVQTAMDQLGFSLTDSEGNVKSLDTVMGDLRNGFKGLSRAEQTQIATSLAGQEAMSGLLAIVNASDEDFNKLKDSIYNADGAAAEMAATMQDNLTGQLTILKSEAEGLGIEIYESIEVPLKNLASVGVKALGDLNEAYASGGFVGFINEIGSKVPILKSFTDAIAGFAEKTKGMSTDELMNLGKLTGVLIGAGPAFSLIGKSAKTFSDVLEGVGDATSGAITTIGKFPGELKNAKGAITGFGGSLKNLGNSIIGPFQVLTPKLNSIIGKTFSFLPTKISGVVGKIAPAVAGKFPKITSAFQEFGGYIGAWGGQVGTAFQGVLGKVAGFMPAFANLMGFGAVLGVVAVGLGLLYSQFGTQIDQILLMMQTKGPEVITNFCNGIVAALPNLIAQGATMLNNLMFAITANLPAIIQGGIAIVSTLITGIAQQLPTLIPTALMMILTLVSSLLSNVGQLVDAGINLLVGLAQGVVNALPQLINKAPTIIGQLATAIISNLPKILLAGIKIITILGTGLIQAVPQLISKIPSIISQVKNAFTSVDWGGVGRNIISGIANGLKGAAGAIVEAAKGAAESALNAAKNFLGIHSPSRVFRDQVGKMMALGMGIGFERNIPVKSMSTGVQRAVAGLQKSVDIALSARTSDKTVGGVKSMPGFDNNDIDYDRLEKIQMKAADKLAKRPIFLDTKRIDTPLPEGAVPVW